jgi:hypothetical protein
LEGEDKREKPALTGMVSEWQELLNGLQKEGDGVVE